MSIGVECIGRGRKATIEWVEQMLQKHEHLTNRLVLVSQTGFTPDAIQMAREHGVETLTLAEALNADWTKVVGKLAQVNIVLPQIDVTHVAISPPLDTSNIDVCSLPFYSNEGVLLCNLLDIVDICRRAPNVLDYVVKNCNEPGNYTFGIERSVPDGSFVMDKAGTKHIVGRIGIAVDVHLEDAIPVDLQFALFKDVQIACGTLKVNDLQGLLTVVEAPDKPISADLRLSPNTTKKQ